MIGVSDDIGGSACDTLAWPERDIEHDTTSLDRDGGDLFPMVKNNNGCEEV